MRKRITVALVGNRSDEVIAHRAIPLALEQAGLAHSVEVIHEWVPTQEIRSTARIAGFDGLWCIPGSPYRSFDGALTAIRHARQVGVPLLGTCGGFQHAVVEYALNVLGWSDAVHAESCPDSGRAVISPLTCGLLDVAGTIRLLEGSRIARAYGKTTISEEYLCSYGVNPEFTAALTGGPLRVVATDPSGDVRGVELEAHPFFVATLFQPERAALRNEPAPLVAAFVRACAD